MFDGDVVLQPLTGERRTLPVSAGYAEAGRGVGLIDMLTAGADRPARAGGDLALHVLDVMTSLLRSAKTGGRVAVSTSVERPSLVPLTDRDTWSGANPSAW
jgi:hypothetical protein